jgi:hypothetical protein
MTFGTAAGCPVSSSAKPLSGGSIFLIVLVCVAIFYPLIGCVYNRHTKGTVGFESCPNLEMWRALPGLVRDGVIFTFRCKRAGAAAAAADSGSGGTYETFK